MVSAAADGLDYEIQVAGPLHRHEAIMDTIGEEMSHPYPRLADAIKNDLRACAVRDVSGPQIGKRPPIGTLPA